MRRILAVLWWWRIMLLVCVAVTWWYVGELVLEGAPVIAYPQAWTLAFIH